MSELTEIELYQGLNAERRLILSKDSGERVKELAWARVDNILDMLSDLRVMESVVVVEAPM